MLNRAQAARQALTCIIPAKDAKEKDDGQMVGPAFGKPELEQGIEMPRN
jgi:hypothetical protein